MIQINYSELITPDFWFIIDTPNRFKKYRVNIKNSSPDWFKVNGNHIIFNGDIPDVYVYAEVTVSFGFSLLKIWKTYDVIFKIEYGEEPKYLFLDNPKKKPFNDFYFKLNYDIRKKRNSED